MNVICPKCKHSFELSMKEHGEKTRKDIYNLLKKPKTWTEIKMKVKVSQPTLLRGLKRLMKEELVAKKYFAKEDKIKYYRPKKPKHIWKAKGGKKK